MPLNLTEARERATLITDVHTTVRLDLTSTEQYTVEAEIAFACRTPGATTFLELSGASDVLVDGREAAYDGERITLSGLAAQNTVRVNATMPYVTDGDGMTVTVDPADGERYVCAFTAMDIAHRVLPCFDQPDLKTTFTVAVSGPSHWTVLANGPSAGSVATTAGTTTWRFGTTPPVATYLFFVAAGPWVGEIWDEPYAGAPGGTIPFGWWARASQEPALRRDAAELRRITSTCFQHYTSVFEAPYAFDDYQQVFTPGLNWGAMEFPGCVAFRDEYLVEGVPTALERQEMATTIAHEMAHMWFGDLVTMRWWEDSWLNESFADFMGYDVAAVAAGYDDAWTGAALTRKPTGYRADLRRSTHPVAEDTEAMPDADTAFANFDMITYAKGNAVLRQLGTWLGDDFLAGVNRHLSAHAFGNATLADFLDSLDASTSRDVRGWAEQWLRSTGFDTIAVSRDGDVPVLTRIGSRPHTFTVVAYDEAAAEVARVRVDLADEPVRLDDLAGHAVVVNAGDETFAAVRLDEQSLALVEAHLSEFATPLTRALLWWQLLERVESRASDLSRLGALLDRHLTRERHPVILEAVLGMSARIAKLYADPESAASLGASLAAVAESALTADEVLHPVAARTLASTSLDVDLLRSWLAGGPAYVDQEVRWIVVRRLAELGHPEPIEDETARDRTVSGHLAELTARAAIATPQAKAEAWQKLMSGELGNHELTAVANGFWTSAELVDPYLERYLDEGLALARTSGQAMSRIIGRAFPVLALPTERRRQLRDRLAEVLHRDVPTVLARTWNDLLDDLDRALGTT
ncbi:aminopeptidase N [Nocardioides montaniterrae]